MVSDIPDRFVGDRLRTLCPPCLDLAIHCTKEPREGATVPHAHAALVADLEGAMKLGLEVPRVPEA